ncbi:MAG: 4-hydroxythreonine-4-phosphate dehydrogenase PdxA [Candidatus Omnitrophota bacterium]
MPKQKIRVVITMGDPSGIGPAITAKALLQLKEEAEFTVIGDAWVFERVQSSKLKAQSIKFIDLKNVNRKSFELGKIKAEYGRASIEYLDRALELLGRGQGDCLVTCPISKEALRKARFPYTGHTEYLSQRTRVTDPVMMLLNRHLRISLATRHIPLARVSDRLDAPALTKTIVTTHHALKTLFSLKEPKIVVCGLNPHASDNGVIGTEENRVIKPVVSQLKKKIKNLQGPLSSDVAIHKAFQGSYDAVIAMYHDQALIPLKLFRENIGVNLTLGLPFVRTSPLHGTAFDIAPHPRLAQPLSLREAIRLAISCTLNQKKG